MPWNEGQHEGKETAMALDGSAGDQENEDGIPHSRSKEEELGPFLFLF